LIYWVTNSDREFSFIKVFDRIDDAGTNDCFKNLKMEVVHKRRILFPFGSIGDKFYIVLEGMVEVWIPEYDTDDQIEPHAFTKVAVLGKGSPFGEHSLLHNDSRQATIICKTNVVFAS
jgi:CRP-like cAMP-binding protein